jgi:leishmanolysin
MGDQHPHSGGSVNSRNLFGLILATSLAVACKDNGPDGPTITVPTGNSQVVPANTIVPNPIVLLVSDAAGKPTANQAVTFSIISGGGAIVGSATATTDATGHVTAPTWRLGKGSAPQKMKATAGAATGEITATVQTGYNIVLRYYGPTPTDAQKAAFTSAAERIMGVVTGDLGNVQATLSTATLDSCAKGSNQSLNETIDDLLIFTTIKPIDGTGKVLARSGPCYTRSGDNISVIGTMEFDSDDLNQLISTGAAQEVVSHEMLHVLGVGTMWPFHPSEANPLVRDTTTTNVKYVGLFARQACQAYGATTTCADYVPVEGLPELPGTRNSHWKEDVFTSELMTGIFKGVGNPMSLITIRSLQDLGYTVNLADSDTYVFPFPASIARIVDPKPQPPWEQVGLTVIKRISADGRITPMRNSP